MDKNNILLQVNNLKLSFNSYLGKAEVLENISFKINKKSWVGIAGESGCGKSITAFSVINLLPESAVIEKGEILFNGERLLDKNKKEMRKIRGKEISIVFQEPRTALNPSMRIGDNLFETIMYHNKTTKKEAREQVINLLKKVRINLPELRIKQYPYELSGGMQQRICIALALASKPALLIADEFTTSLDVTIQKEIIDLLIDIQKAENLAILFISHDLALIKNSCDYVIIMYAGQIMERGSVDKVFNNPSHPYTKALLNSIPTISMKDRILESIQGFVPSLINPPKGCRFHTRCRFAVEGICDKSFPKEEIICEDHQVWCYRYDELKLENK